MNPNLRSMSRDSTSLWITIHDLDKRSLGQELNRHRSQLHRLEIQRPKIGCSQLTKNCHSNHMNGNEPSAAVSNLSNWESEGNQLQYPKIPET
uniref:HTH_Tnp_Tc3_1 domain-containing protein n=1 Tax=Caenorhabditis tropicalis TaxID=1561998 RepID=A0A1I7UAH5_9PELO